MSQKIKLVLLSIAAAALTVAPGQSQVVDTATFDDPTFVSTYVDTTQPYSYLNGPATDNGITFTGYGSGTILWEGAQFPPSGSGYGANDGSNFYLQEVDSAGDQFSINLANGGSFNLTSFDAGGGYGAPASATLVLTGFETNGAFVTTDVDITNEGFATFNANNTPALAEFTGLSSVTFAALGSAPVDAGIDNVTLTSAPEPCTTGLFLAGAAWMLGRRCRKRRPALVAVRQHAL